MTKSNVIPTDCLYNSVTELKHNEIAGCKTKYAILYHADCVDGFTAAWACTFGLMSVKQIKGKDITIAPVTYGDPILPLLTDAVEHIYVVDFSLQSYMLEELTKTKRVTVIDHHDTAAKMYGLSGNFPVYNKRIHKAEIVFNPEESGASLVWEYFFGIINMPPNIIKQVRARDLWRKVEHTDEIHETLCITDKSLNSWQAIANSLEDATSYKAIVSRGRSLLKYKENIVNQIAQNAVEIELLGVIGYAAACPRSLSSDVGEAIGEKYPDTFYAAMYTCIPSEDGKQIIRIDWSLRSRGGYAVNRLCEKFGGGGHPAAAGFSSRPNLLQESIPSLRLKADSEGKRNG